MEVNGNTELTNLGNSSGFQVASVQKHSIPDTARTMSILNSNLS